MMSLERFIRKGIPTGGQSTFYDELPIPLFISGYLAMMKTEKLTLKLMTHHIQELMADMELYGWEPIHSYHAIWLQQIENLLC